MIFYLIVVSLIGIFASFLHSKAEYLTNLNNCFKNQKIKDIAFYIYKSLA